MTSADLHPSTHLRASAWVPDDVEDRPYEDAIALAADWIWERSQDEDSAPLLVSNAQNAASFGYADLDEIIRAGGHATPQSRSRPDRGPVLAFVPDERSLHFAMGLARGHSLAVVEGSTPLAEWAAGAAAIKLPTGEVTTSEMDDDVRNDLDSVIFYGGRNGWTGADDKAQARRFLSGHVSGGRLTPDQAAAYVLSSQSVSDRGAKRLRDLLSSHSR
ncbi:hypothetical protein [Mycolicibacterium sp. NCC-Tsukiji]|uniref:hypothetical protein n=1 Tax=Mycolicibacterium sp. NCC-Tsukiji TaxID=2185272 RepID=UPI000EBEF0C5|nr:hypothetical protein [Mycolicibacterium sp. NCC-Tsukiji]GCB01757.1 hypothetical protein NCCNTM_53910 [Mycolicibacterium sp. NCC-Tsukiji]